MKRLVLLVGVPGSGKTTLSKKLTGEGFERLCADDIRFELYGDEAEQGNPKDVFAIFFERLDVILAADKDIVIDNTNVRRNHRQEIIEHALKFKYEDIQLWLLEVPLAECLKRNKERTRQVDEKIVTRLFNDLSNFHKPKSDEGRLVIVTPSEDGSWTFLFS